MAYRKPDEGQDPGAHGIDRAYGTQLRSINV